MEFLISHNYNTFDDCVILFSMMLVKLHQINRKKSHFLKFILSTCIKSSYSFTMLLSIA